MTLSRRKFVSGSLSLCSLTVFEGCSKSQNVVLSSKIKLARIKAIQPGMNEFPVERVLIIKSENNFDAISMICTHQECLLRRSDSGFLCPCHGSMFDLEGKVLKGPAIHDLKRHPVWVEEEFLYVDLTKTL